MLTDHRVFMFTAASNWFYQLFSPHTVPMTWAGDTMVWMHGYYSNGLTVIHSNWWREENGVATVQDARDGSSHVPMSPFFGVWFLLRGVIKDKSTQGLSPMQHEGFWGVQLERRELSYSFPRIGKSFFWDLEFRVLIGRDPARLLQPFLTNEAGRDFQTLIRDECYWWWAIVLFSYQKPWTLYDIAYLGWREDILFCLFLKIKTVLLLQGLLAGDPRLTNIALFMVKIPEYYFHTIQGKLDWSTLTTTPAMCSFAFPLFK